MGKKRASQGIHKRSPTVLLFAIQFSVPDIEVVYSIWWLTSNRLLSQPLRSSCRRFVFQQLKRLLELKIFRRRLHGRSRCSSLTLVFLSSGIRRLLNSVVVVASQFVRIDSFRDFRAFDFN